MRGLRALAGENESWEWTAPVGPGNASYANGYENGRRAVGADLRALLTGQNAKRVQSRLYVAGPMTGLPEFNFPAFNSAEAALRALGRDVRNPARHGAGDPDATWADYMRRDIADLLECDGVALLPGWEKSSGATLEEHIAQTLGLQVAPLDQWLTPPESPTP